MPEPNVDSNVDSKPESEFVNTIPEAYRDKPWAKENSADADSFYKFVDNQNALVGKKGIIIPEDGEDRSEFYKALGRPDTFEEYDTAPAEDLKEIKRDAEVDVAFKKLFHTAGLPKATATEISQGIERIIYEKGKAEIDKSNAEDKAFADYNTTLFGENKDTIVANAQKIIKADVPQELHAGLDKIDGEALSVLVAITDSLYKKYGKEDAFTGGGDGADGAGETYEGLSAQQRKLMENPGYKDFRHAEYDGLMAQNKVLMDKMRVLKP